MMLLIVHVCSQGVIQVSVTHSQLGSCSGHYFIDIFFQNDAIAGKS